MCSSGCRCRRRSRGFRSVASTVAVLDPTQVDTAKTLPCDARRTEVEIGVQVVIENRIEIDETAIERCLHGLLNGGRLKPLFQFR